MYGGISNYNQGDQFFDSCPKILADHLRERDLADLGELARVAERFLDGTQQESWHI